jgi:hypothetical protein
MKLRPFSQVTIPQLVKKFRLFMELEFSLPHTQQPITCLYPETDGCNRQQDIFIMYLIYKIESKIMKNPIYRQLHAFFIIYFNVVRLSMPMFSKLSAPLIFLV